VEVSYCWQFCDEEDGFGCGTVEIYIKGRANCGTILRECAVGFCYNTVPIIIIIIIIIILFFTDKELYRAARPETKRNYC
jgi:hypothetical protein